MSENHGPVASSTVFANRIEVRGALLVARQDPRLVDVARRPAAEVGGAVVLDDEQVARVGEPEVVRAAEACPVALDDDVADDEPVVLPSSSSAHTRPGSAPAPDSLKYRALPPSPSASPFATMPSAFTNPQAAGW